MVFRRTIRPLRRLAASFFYEFGLHCAQNQIRVILISGLVIGSLFYPALAVYFSSQPLSHFSTRIHDSVFGFNSVTAGYRADLREIWEGFDGVRIREDSAAKARCGAERTIRLERILIPTVLPGHDFGALNRETVLAGLRFQDRIHEALKTPHGASLECIKFPDSNGKECLALGPFSRWSDDKRRLSADIDIVVAINSAKNHSRDDIPLEKEAILAGRGPMDDRGWIYDADFLVLTYLFNENDCHTTTKHTAWTQLLQDSVAGHGTLSVPTTQSTLIALEYNITQPTYRSSVLSLILYICYIVIFVYLSGSLRRIDTVHSRFGLAFTGLVEILASTITSASVCALWGFRVTMVPWAILPVMIVFIGAEDMFILIQEVVSTSVELPVKERIARGLSRGGTSNTFKVVTYNAIFGSMAAFTTGAIKQFCIFTVVVLTAHWFLIHTFFVAVLAIDIQRLELADLIHQGPKTQRGKDSPTAEAVIEGASHPKSKDGAWLFRRDRAAKNGSLLVILSITALLYYYSLPNTPPVLKDIPTKARPNAARASFMQSFGGSMPTGTILDDLIHHTQPNPSIPEYADEALLRPPSPSAHFWRFFNPENDALLHLRIEAPYVANLRPESGSTEEPIGHTVNNRRTLYKTFRPLIWTFKIIVLPMSATIIALYLLLLYLLKDADRLEAQRNKAEPGSPASSMPNGRDSDSRSEPSLAKQATLTLLSRVFAADVALVAGSSDGRVVAAISTGNEFALWHLRGDDSGLEADCRVAYLSTVLAGVLKDEPSDVRIAAIAVNEDGGQCAIGLSSGLLLQWNLIEVPGKTIFARCVTGTPISQIHFCSPSAPPMTSSASTIKAFSISLPQPLLAMCDDGSAHYWDANDTLVPTPLPISGPIVAVAPTIWSTDQLHVAFVLQSGHVDVVIKDAPGPCLDHGEWRSKQLISVAEDGELVSQLHLNGFFVGTRHAELLAVALTTGQVTVYDCTTGRPICSVSDAYGEVSRLRILSVPWNSCKRCGEKEPDSFLIAYSIGSDVCIHRAAVSLVPNRCACPAVRVRPSLGRNTMREKYADRSRHGSLSATSSPPRVRSALPRVPGMTDYPLPGHGFHSRRATASESKSRQSIETNSDYTDLDAESTTNEPSYVFLSVQNSNEPPAPPRSNSDWGAVKVLLVAELPCDRGLWEISDSTVLGIRRRPRDRSGSTTSKTSDSLLETHLTRWEAWSFQAETSNVQWSSLESLLSVDGRTPGELNKPLTENRLIRRNSGLRRLAELAEATPKAGSTLSLPGSQALVQPSRHPTLPFTRVSSMYISGKRLIVGFGNTTGILDFSAQAAPRNIALQPPPQHLFPVSALHKKLV